MTNRQKNSLHHSHVLSADWLVTNSAKPHASSARLVPIMNTMKIAIKVLVAFLALSLIWGSASGDFASQLVGSQRYGFCMMTFGSVVFLHLLIWQFIVGASAILGRDPKSFIEYGKSKSFYSGLTALGYVGLALYLLRIAAPNVFGSADGRVYGLAFGLTLIGIGLAARLRILFQSRQTIPE